MKKKVIIALIIFIIIIVMILSYLHSKIILSKKQAYVNYINEILPNITQGNLETVTGRENIARISNIVKIYYNTCENNDLDMLRSILNKEYINYMDLDLENIIKYNKKRIKIKENEINTIYKINENIYFASVKNIKEYVCFVGIIFNDDKTKYSIFLDGIYNYNDVKKYELEKEYEYEYDYYENKKKEENKE